MIRLQGIGREFGTIRAVSDINLVVNAGEIFGLVGPDGAGKTTLIRMITGIIAPSHGQIEVLGSTSAEQVKGELGYVPQKFSLYGDLTVMENIRVLGALYGASDTQIASKAREILLFTNLWEFKDRLADNLSGGMKQKLALAAGLMHRPKLFFLDEPTTGVDPVSRREFWQMLYRLNKEGMTVFVSTPYMDEAELCTRIAFMHHGTITACDTPDTLRQSYPFHVLELSVNRKDVKKLLQDCGIVDVNAFGEKYHLVVEEPTTATAAISARLVEAGISEFSLITVPPTLEDVFVALAGEAS